MTLAEFKDLATKNVSINSTSEEVRSRLLYMPTHTIWMGVSINSTSEEVRSLDAARLFQVLDQVSINSTSEEVRSFFGSFENSHLVVSINSTSEEVRSRNR